MGILVDISHKETMVSVKRFFGLLCVMACIIIMYNGYVYAKKVEQAYHNADEGKKARFRLDLKNCGRMMSDKYFYNKKWMKTRDRKDVYMSN